MGKVLNIIVSIIAIVLLFLGLLFRVESWEGATKMLIIGFSILILSVIIYVYRTIKAKDFSKAVTFSGLTFFLAGSLCKIESWESGLELSLIGRILIYLGVFLMIFKVIKEKIKQ